ncbi:zincin-like metallopeptidase domain-containing protein [Dialister micraerophilus]|uniref:zincin-like metallopeptidase domain-containing protein n=1 Tax=Dialister micraerophilus TaxID=309120 RepID=UPI0023F0BCB7|nr:zincin-like metallopeptidase domain-containing protein [Dialister micraerophilus]
MTKLQESQQEFINELISLMEKGKLIWESGYAMTGVKDFNPITGKSYSGGNCFKLMYSSQRNKFADPRWMTFKQAKEHGYILKKGSKGTLLKVYIPSTFERVIDENNEIELREKHKGGLKFFYVFNAEQFQNVPEINPEIYNHEEKNKIFENLIQNSEAKIYQDQVNRNYYSPQEDEIHVMSAERFENLENWYSTVAHEIAHSTGHKSRLNRQKDIPLSEKKFGTVEYAKEELRAELTSALLSKEFGLKITEFHKENHAAYLKSWMSVLKDNPNEFFKAAADAEKAVKYIKENMIKKDLIKEIPKEMLLEDITEKNKIKNKDEALEAIEKNPWILKHIDKKLQENREIVETAIKKEPLTLQYANESLKSDIGLVSIATTKKAEAFKYASNVLKANADFVKQIVDKQPQALQYADALIKNNVDVVLTAAEKDINVLEYAGKQITEDKYVMKTLIMKNPEAIKYVGEKLKKEDFLEKKQTKEKPKLNLSKPSGKGLER